MVPITTAIKPGNWYNTLLRYKTVDKQLGWIIAGLVSEYLHHHWSSISTLLGGEGTMLTIVPSKKSGVTYENQTLRRVLEIACKEIVPVQRTLRFERSGDWQRQACQSDAFKTTVDVAGETIVLVEDTWTSGATAVSSACALLRDGAAAVMILPIARQIALDFHGEEHPYVEASKMPYDISSWPRRS